MIKEVLELGIKGQDIVVSTLQKIQKDKEKFSSKAVIRLTPPQKKPEPTAAPSVGTTAKDEDQRRLNREREQEKRVRDITEKPMNAVQGVATLQAGAASKSIMEGIAGGAAILNPVAGAIAMAAAKLGGAVIDAAHTFKDQVKSAAITVADSEDARNRVLNIMGKGNEGFLRTQRVDIDVNSQRAIAEALSEKYGIVTDHLRRSVERLFGDKNRPTDVKQATALATGNFASLGDKGFFMQKIADSFSGLPPTVRDELMAHIQNMIPTGELLDQRDKGIREINTKINDIEREKAVKMVGYDEKTKQYTNVNQALILEKTINDIDTALNKGMGKVVDALEKFAKKFGVLSDGAESQSHARTRRATN